MPGDYAPSQAAAYAVYSGGVELKHVVRALNRAGFHNEDICLLLAEEHPLAGCVRNLRLRPDDAPGSAMAELVQWMSRLGAVVIPRVGLFIRSRIFFRSLIAEPKTATCIGNIDALRNLSIPESELSHFAGLLNDSSGFVYVNCGFVDQSDRAKEILRSTGGEEARCWYEVLPTCQPRASGIGLPLSAASPPFLLKSSEGRARPIQA